MTTRASRLLWLATTLAVAVAGAGAIWWDWTVHGFGPNCSNSDVVGPHPPAFTSAWWLVLVPAFLAASARATSDKKFSWFSLAGFAVLGGALAALAILVATIAFGFSRNCYS